MGSGSKLRVHTFRVDADLKGVIHRPSSRPHWAEEADWGRENNLDSGTSPGSQSEPPEADAEEEEEGSDHTVGSHGVHGGARPVWSSQHTNSWTVWSQIGQSLSRDPGQLSSKSSSKVSCAWRVTNGGRVMSAWRPGPDRFCKAAILINLTAILINLTAILINLTAILN